MKSILKKFFQRFNTVKVTKIYLQRELQHIFSLSTDVYITVGGRTVSNNSELLVFSVGACDTLNFWYSAISARFAETFRILRGNSYGRSRRMNMQSRSVGL